jgi:hypothetical protein
MPKKAASLDARLGSKCPNPSAAKSSPSPSAWNQKSPKHSRDGRRLPAPRRGQPRGIAEQPFALPPPLCR